MCSPEIDLTLGTAVAATHPVLGVFVCTRKEDRHICRHPWPVERNGNWRLADRWTHIRPLQTWTDRRMNCNVNIHVSAC